MAAADQAAWDGYLLPLQQHGAAASQPMQLLLHLLACAGRQTLHSMTTAGTAWVGASDSPA